jgi:hypothetical protein
MTKQHSVLSAVNTPPSVAKRLLWALLALAPAVPPFVVRVVCV